MLKKMLLATTLVASPAYADIISLNGLTPITAPAFVGSNFLEQQGLPNQVIFAEQQGVTLGSTLFVDGSSVAAGTRIDSYFVAFNRPDTIIVNASATFSGQVLGVIFTDLVNGWPDSNYFASDFLGAPGTTYAEANCQMCGFEVLPGTPGSTGMFAGDAVSFQGNTVLFTSNYSEPGDYARIIVDPAQPVPGPIVGGGLPGLLGLLGLWWYRRQRDATRLIQPPLSGPGGNLA